MCKAWVIGDLLIVNRRSRSFFCDRDRYRRLPFVKRLQDDRGLEIQWSRSKNAIAFFFERFFQQLTYCRSNIPNMPELKEWTFRKKTFCCIKQAFLQMIMNKLAFETCEKWLRSRLAIFFKWRSRSRLRSQILRSGSFLGNVNVSISLV